MTFPVVATTNYSEETADTTTHDVLVPASIAAGDLLLLLTSIQSNTVSQPTVTGWTALFWLNGAGNVSMGIWYKFASGSETDFTYTTSSSEKSANRTWRVTGAHDSSAPEVGVTGTDGNSASPGGFSPTASWGADDNLFVDFVAANSTNPGFTVNQYPTNYANNQFEARTGVTAADAALAHATRNLNAASDSSPGNFVLATAVNCIGKCLVIRPATVGGSVLDPFGMTGFFGG